MIEPVPLTSKEKVQILLAEYSTLRTEILQRNSVLNQILTVGGASLLAIISFLFARQELIALFMGLALLFIVLPCLAIYAIGTVDFDTLAAAQRLREIESAINKMADERLLIWETDNGLYKVGLGRRLDHSIKLALKPFNWAARR
jgi:hypothetical protein